MKTNSIVEKARVEHLEWGKSAETEKNTRNLTVKKKIICLLCA